MAHRQWAASGRRVRLESSSALSGGETDETVESRRKETSRDEPRRAAISDLQTNESNARRKLNLLVPMIGSDRKWTNCNQQALHVAAAAAGPVAYMCVFSSHCRCAAPLPRARHTRPPAGRPATRSPLVPFLSVPFRSSLPAVRSSSPFLFCATLVSTSLPQATLEIRPLLQLWH